MKYQTTILLVLFTLFMIGCDEPEYEIRNIKVVSFEIPATGTMHDPIDIQIHAQGSNGCYTNLKATLNHINNTNYQIVATAKFNTEGSCTLEVVDLNTTISFTPTKAGKYYITANNTPYSILRDTITVY